MAGPGAITAACGERVRRVALSLGRRPAAWRPALRDFLAIGTVARPGFVAGFFLGPFFETSLIFGRVDVIVIMAGRQSRSLLCLFSRLILVPGSGLLEFGFSGWWR